MQQHGSIPSLKEQQSFQQKTSAHLVRGFTLIELLMVIGIIAVISVAILLTLNPAELLRQSRDSTRLHDLSTLKSALSLYLADVASPILAGTGVLADYQKCYLSQAPGTIATARCGVFSASGIITSNTSTTAALYRGVDGTGWIPVNFNQVTSKAPVSTLPVDPINNATYYYAYAASSSLIYELDAAKLESTKYTSGVTDKVSTDGGDNATAYEVGTAAGLAL